MTLPSLSKRSWIFSGIVLILILAALLAGTSDRRPVLVCLGDSLTSCGGDGGRYSDWLQTFLPKVRVINSGVSGDTLDGGCRRFQKDVLAHRPRVTLIALGANDFWRNIRPVEAMKTDLEEMITRAQAAGSAVVIASCFGDRDFWDEVCTEFAPRAFELARKMAVMEKAVCEAHNCPYIPNMQIDIKPDRLPPFWDETDHPSKEGNREIALRLLPAIRQALAQPVSKPVRH